MNKEHCLQEVEILSESHRNHGDSMEACILYDHSPKIPTFRNAFLNDTLVIINSFSRMYVILSLIQRVCSSVLYEESTNVIGYRVYLPKYLKFLSRDADSILSK